MNEIQLQRCVDGEMEDADRIEFLKSLEAAQSLTSWRALALGLLENQALQAALRHREPEQAAIASNVVNSKQRDFSLSARVRSVGMLCGGIALGFLVAFLLWGTMVAGPVESGGQDKLVADTDRDTDLTEDGHTARMQSPEPVMHLEMDRPGGGSPISIPVFTAEQYEVSTHKQVVDPFPKQLQSRLEDRGYQIHRKPQVYRLPLEGGKQILLPMESIEVEYAVF